MHTTAFLLALVAVPFCGALANAEAMPEAIAEPQLPTIVQNWQQQTEKVGLGADGKGKSKFKFSGAIDGVANAQNPASLGGDFSMSSTVTLPGTAPAFPSQKVAKPTGFGRGNGNGNGNGNGKSG